VDEDGAAIYEGAIEASLRLRIEDNKPPPPVTLYGSSLAVVRAAAMVGCNRGRVTLMLPAGAPLLEPK
jgi:hypothetical protein